MPFRLSTATRENLNESEVKEFYRILSKAKSNRRHDGSGRSIALTCDKMVSGAVEATTYFILNRTFAQQIRTVTTPMASSPLR